LAECCIPKRMAPSGPPAQELPEPALVQICTFLDLESILLVPVTCKLLRDCAYDDDCWVYRRVDGGADPSGRIQHISNPRLRYRIARFAAIASQQDLDLNRRGQWSLDRSLRIAVDRGHFSISQLLLDANADPDQQDDHIGVGYTQVGAYALHFAAKRGHTGIVELLLERKAAVDTVDQNGRAALHLAAAHDKTEAVAACLRAKADVDAIVCWGFTPLHFAAMRPNPSAFHLLLDSDARPSVVSNDNKTPMIIVANHLKRKEPVHPQGLRKQMVHGDEYVYEATRRESSMADDEVAVGMLQALIRCKASLSEGEEQGLSVEEIIRRKDRTDVLERLRR